MNIDKALQESRERLAMIIRESEKEHDPATLRAYEKYEKAERDYISEINATKREIAKKALAEGASIELVSKITGLDVESVKKL